MAQSEPSFRDVMCRLAKYFDLDSIQVQFMAQVLLGSSRPEELWLLR